MNRRRYLQVAAAATAGGLAGCGGGTDATTTTADPYASAETVLSAPDLDGRPTDYPWPVHGQDLPSVTLAAPLDGREISTTGFDTPILVTFFYSTCMTACPQLISTLRNVRVQLGEDGASDAAQFLPITFDPERDDAATLRQYSDRMNVDHDAGNWHYLRPDGREGARDVVADTFGVVFERTHPEDMDQYMFDHRSLIVLANADGVVERTYRGTAAAAPITEDLTTVLEA